MPEVPGNNAHKKALLYAVCVGAILTLLVFVVGNSKINSLSETNKALLESVATIQSQTTKQDNINRGIPEIDNKVGDDNGKVSLLDGKLLFDLPENWSRALEDSCSGGARDLYLLCYDIAAIAPNTMIGEGGKASWKANIAIYDRKSRSSAKEWLEEDYYGEPLTRSTIPKLLLKEEAVNGQELTYLRIYGPTEDPEDVVSYYVVLRDKYVVFVSAQTVSRGESVKEPYDYRQDLLPALEKFVKSLEFRD